MTWIILILQKALTLLRWNGWQVRGRWCVANDTVVCQVCMSFERLACGKSEHTPKLPGTSWKMVYIDGQLWDLINVRN